MTIFAQSNQNINNMEQQRYREILKHIQDAICRTKFENHVYAVGGCVRDEVLGSPKIKDIDLVISLPNGGIDFARFMESSRLTRGSIVVYETYGTAMFRLQAFPDEEIECVQTRKEQYHDINSRNPETSYGTLEEDCMRRDLTINALYFNVSTFQMTDPCGKGLEDIREKNIRVTSTPDIVYNDDPLRILRAIRFYCRFGNSWTLDSDTLNGMEKNAHRLEIITAERKQDELNKILMTDNASMGIWMIRSIGAMDYVIPELTETYDMEQNEYHSGTVWVHTLKVLENVDISGIDNPDDILVLHMAALLHDIGKIETRTVDADGHVHFYKHELSSVKLIEIILRRLKYANDFIKDVQFLSLNHMMTKQWKDDISGTKHKTRSIRKLQYLCKTRHRFDMLMRLIDADNRSHAPEHCLPTQVKIIRQLSEEMCSSRQDMFEFKLPVNGDDIMTFKGIKPGREIKDYQEYMLKLCFNNPTLTKEELLDKIKNLSPDKLHPHRQNPNIT